MSIVVLETDPQPISSKSPGFAGQIFNLGSHIRDGFMSACSFAFGLFYVHPETAVTFMSSFTLWLTQGLRIRERLHSIQSFCFFKFDSPGFEFDGGDQIEDFFGSHRGGSKFLGHYCESDCEDLIRKSPAGAALQSQGITDWYVEFDLGDPFLHYAYIRRRSIPARDQYLGYLIVESSSFKYDRETNPAAPGTEVVHSRFPLNSDILNIRWLSLQNPVGNFTPDRPRLPGQRYPGSKLGRTVLSLICELAEARGRDGLVNLPEHFHNAYLYENFKFLNPDDQGTFERMSCDLKSAIEEKGLAMVSWAIYLGFLRCGGQKVVWDLKEQILPLSKPLKGYFASKQYRAAVENRKRNSGPFTISWDQEETRTLTDVLRS
jgi:hypothetical protein